MTHMLPDTGEKLTLITFVTLMATTGSKWPKVIILPKWMAKWGTLPLQNIECFTLGRYWNYSPSIINCKKRYKYKRFVTFWPTYQLRAGNPAEIVKWASRDKGWTLHATQTHVLYEITKIDNCSVIVALYNAG